MTDMDEQIKLKDKPRFSRRELWAALAMYPVAFAYTMMTGPDYRLWFGVFALLFVTVAEYVFRGRPRSGESWVWLGSMAVIVLCVAFQWGRVWDQLLSMFFAHGLAVLWLLSRGGLLLERESGHLFPFDVFNGVIRFPFGGFFLRFSCLRQGVAQRRKPGEGVRASSIPAVVLALCLAALMLYWATASLASADSGFYSLVKGILEALAIENSEELTNYIVRFLLSLPIGAWLFGLIVGGFRADRAALDAQAERLCSGLQRLRVVPQRLWTWCMGAFALVYLLFFAVQSSYLFGAFTRTLPEGFIVSQYAREGFFELCRVMAINFALLWLVSRTGDGAERSGKADKVMRSLLLVAGMLFAVVAISKLMLYISCFGFTPRRLQSTWIALVLLAGSAAALYSLWTEKKSFRMWLMFAAVTLALLHLY